MPLSLNEIIAQAVEQNASDVHLVCGLPIRLRLVGELEDLNDQPLTAEDCEAYGRQLLRGWTQDAFHGEADLAVTFPGQVRTRVNVFRQQGVLSAAIRILHDRIPQLSELGLPPVVDEFSSYPRGIVLVTGATGSGKSTTLAAILNSINHTRKAHILTLEDPIEYVHRPDLCVINQREIGRDTQSYADGLRAALREDPDVILIGEMRDLVTIETALTAAETGHLVFATLHTNSAPDAINRIVDVFPEGGQRQIRAQLSITLRAVLSQHLIPRKDGSGRVAACEVMVVTPAIRNLIREGKTPQMANSMATSADEGSITMDNTLIRLYKEGTISGASAVGEAMNPDVVRKNIGM